MSGFRASGLLCESPLKGSFKGLLSLPKGGFNFGPRGLGLLEDRWEFPKLRGVPYFGVLEKWEFE